MPFSHNFDGWFKNIQKKLDQFDKAKQQVVRGVSIQCLADLQQESPVDYGRYRAAHTLSIMEPSSLIPPEVIENEKIGHVQGSALHKFNSLAEEQMNNAKDKLSEIKVHHGLRIFITNNVDYAQYIEDGSYTDKPGAPKQVYGIVSLRYDRILAQELAKV